MAKSESSARGKQTATKRRDTVPAESKGLDFSKGVRGKYYEHAMASRNLVMLDPVLLDTFPDSDSVNAALHTLRDLAKRAATTPRRPKRAA